eukprot:IDg14396t1
MHGRSTSSARVCRTHTTKREDRGRWEVQREQRQADSTQYTGIPIILAVQEVGIPVEIRVSRDPDMQANVVARLNRSLYNYLSPLWTFELVLHTAFSHV